jgi:hypothetical protein
MFSLTLYLAHNKHYFLNLTSNFVDVRIREEAYLFLIEYIEGIPSLQRGRRDIRMDVSVQHNFRIALVPHLLVGNFDCGDLI